MNPVVMIGKSGLTDAVVKEIDVALKSHELIKIKLLDVEKSERDSIFDEICARLEAQPVQHIGKILVLYRPAEKPKIVLP